MSERQLALSGLYLQFGMEVFGKGLVQPQKEGGRLWGRWFWRATAEASTVRVSVVIRIESFMVGDVVEISVSLVTDWTTVMEWE